MLRKGVVVVLKFNVFKNPHAGGALERAIKTVKNGIFLCIRLNVLLAIETRLPNDFEFIKLLAYD